MNQNQASSGGSSPLTLVIFWLYVGIPLLLGVSSTLKQAMALFR
ncbi:MAG TPA: hypothetical protein VMV91_17010 [Rhodocyclaceae bacterium]|nr:hypothetical protein [Rhodocyclaceae bacterium]